MGFFTTDPSKLDYTNQVIVKGGVYDESINKMAVMLQEKAEEKGLHTQIVDLDAIPNGTEEGTILNKGDTITLKKAMSDVTTGTRLYLIGHGEWQQQTMGGLKASVWARRLAACGLKKVPKLISIVGCNAARDKGTTKVNRINVSISSFASQFHEKLKTVHGLETFVFARPYTVRVYSGGVKKKTTHTHEGRALPDKKLPSNAKEQHHGERRKLCFFWENGVQKRKWVVYVQGAQQLLPITADEMDGVDESALPDFGPDEDDGVNRLASSGGIGENPGSLTSSWGDIPEFNE